MNTKRIALMLSTIICGALVLSSCTVRVAHRPPQKVVVVKHGPPPHAPAHGYRHHHQGYVFIYSTTLGVYAIEGHPGYYWHKKKYYRAHNGSWYMSSRFDGKWKVVGSHKVPRGLYKHKGHHAKHKATKKKHAQKEHVRAHEQARANKGHRAKRETRASRELKADKEQKEKKELRDKKNAREVKEEKETKGKKDAKEVKDVKGKKSTKAKKEKREKDVKAKKDKETKKEKEEKEKKEKEDKEDKESEDEEKDKEEKD